MDLRPIARAESPVEAPPASSGRSPEPSVIEPIPREIPTTVPRSGSLVAPREREPRPDPASIPLVESTPPSVAEPPKPGAAPAALPIDVPPPRPASAPEASGPKGRAVASIGDEVITLPELTTAVKARIGQLGPGQAPTRRQVIALARATLKGMIVRSLVFQEARETLNGAGGLEAARSRFERTWADRELPELLRREGVATEAELRSKLAGRLATPESLRDEYVVRSVAAELIGRDRPGLDFDGYLDALRRRRPVSSIMSPAELMAAGRRAAGDREAAR